MRNNYPKIKNSAYVINLYEYKCMRTLWIALYVSGHNVTYFGSSRTEHIPQDNKSL